MPDHDPHAEPCHAFRALDGSIHASELDAREASAKHTLAQVFESWHMTNVTYGGQNVVDLWDLFKRPKLERDLPLFEALSAWVEAMKVARARQETPL